MLVVVTYESRTGNTQRAGQLVGGAMADAGADVVSAPIDRVDLKALADADLIFLGTWVAGHFIIGQKPAMATKIYQELPDLWHKPVVGFLTYALNPGKAAEKMGDLVRAKGARYLGGTALHRRRLDDEVGPFVDGVIEQLTTAS